MRDKEGHEVDFVVTLNRRVHWLIEVKMADENISPGLRYYTSKLRPRAALQLVLKLDRPREQSGIKVLPLAKWLDGLALDGLALDGLALDA